MNAHPPVWTASRIQRVGIRFLRLWCGRTDRSIPSGVLPSKIVLLLRQRENPADPFQNIIEGLGHGRGIGHVVLPTMEQPLCNA